MAEDPRERVWYNLGLAVVKDLEERLADAPDDEKVVVFGAGRTVKQALKAFYAKGLHNKYKVACGSKGTEEYARLLGIELVPATKLEPQKYIYIDGADQIDTENNLIKGGLKIQSDATFTCEGDPGKEGCMFREKNLAYGAKTFIVIADYGKRVEYLGQNGYPLPVEFDPEEAADVETFLRQELNSNDIRLRYKSHKDAEPTEDDIFITENDKFIFDVFGFDGRKMDLVELEDKFNTHPYILSVGLFAKRKPDKVLIAEESGEISSYE